MNSIEYKAAKALSCITVNDIWCVAIKVTKDQDKAYSSGRTPIPEKVKCNVVDLVNLIKESSASLVKQLQDSLPKCSIEIDNSDLSIQICFPSKKIISVKCCGLDIANLWPLYMADRSTRGEAVFVYASKNLLENIDNYQRDCKTRRWFLWRGDFVESREFKRFQSYWNELEEELLMEAFKRYRY